MKQVDEYEDLWVTNRQRKLSSFSGKFWCQCDFNLVGKWKKCEVCGARNGKRVNKP